MTMNTKQNVEPTPAKRAYSIPEVCRTASIGRTRLYSEISEGRLRAVKVGRRTLIRAEDLDAWLRSLGNSPQGGAP